MATAENRVEIDAVISKLEKTVFAFSKRDRKGLLTKAAAPVRKELRAKTRQRRRGAKVNVVGGREYRPGNLKRSMRTLTKLRRSPSVFVGPDIGKNAKNDGYYYAMAYGSRATYQRELLRPVQEASEGAAIAAFRKEFAKRFGTRAAQQKLNVS